jgi:hypothetical protein
MSKVSEGIHVLENTIEQWLGHLPPEGQAAVKTAISTAQTAASTAIVVNSSALDTVWNALEQGLEAAMNATETALLGPSAASVSIPLSDAAYEAMAAKGKSFMDAFIASRKAQRPAA